MCIHFTYYIYSCTHGQNVLFMLSRLFFDPILSAQSLSAHLTVPINLGITNNTIMLKIHIHLIYHPATNFPSRFCSIFPMNRPPRKNSKRASLRNNSKPLVKTFDQKNYYGRHLEPDNLIATSFLFSK